MTQGEQSGNGKPLVEVKNLSMYFPVTSGIVFQKKVADIKARCSSKARTWSR